MTIYAERLAEVLRRELGELEYWLGSTTVCVQEWFGKSQKVLVAVPVIPAPRPGNCLVLCCCHGWWTPPPQFPCYLMLVLSLGLEESLVPASSFDLITFLGTQWMGHDIQGAKNCIPSKNLFWGPAQEVNEGRWKKHQYQSSILITSLVLIKWHACQPKEPSNSHNRAAASHNFWLSYEQLHWNEYRTCSYRLEHHITSLYTTCNQHCESRTAEGAFVTYSKHTITAVLATKSDFAICTAEHLPVDATSA